MFQDEEGQTRCDACPKGMFAENHGSATCTSCPSGYVSNVLAGVKCEKCPPGSSSMDGISCGLCPAGTHSLSLNEGHGDVTQCIPCSIGTATNVEGTLDICPKCPEGSFSDKEGGTTCNICPKGTRFVNTHSPCEDCEAGNQAVK